MEPFIGMIVQFGGNFAPRGWALCDGQLLSISQYTSLFSILGTTYGGDGKTTFALPDLRGRVAIHPGHGPGLSNYQLGQKGGAQTVTLTVNNMPSHNHTLSGINAQGTDGVENATLANTKIFNPDAPDTPMHADVIGNRGGSQPFSIRQPYQSVNFIIALQGLYPSRN